MGKNSKQYVMTMSEERFADLVWENEPLGSGELVRKCEQAFQWKKSTTYTVLKKLCEAGVFRNEDSLVTSLLTREEYHQHKSEKFVEDNFGGSLPGFLSAFMRRKKLSANQIREIKALIDEYEED